MRISAAEIGVHASGAAPTPFPAPGGFSPSESLPDPEDDVAPASWSVRQSDYQSDVWTTGEADPPPAATSPPTTPWEIEAVDDLPAAEEKPVWRPDPGSWEAESLYGAPAEESASEVEAFSPPATDSYFPLEEASSDFATPPPPAASLPFASEPASVDDEEEAPFGSDDDDEDEVVAVEVGLDLESSVPLTPPSAAQAVEVPRPSALAAAQGPDSALAINSIDARELVAGLFERWERALEQRIQAEQRLRFEAELERRLRQVRDLRQELENTRKSTAAQLAEREQEVLALRSRLREQDSTPGKNRGGIFRR